jgi:hypothetical protein
MNSYISFDFWAIFRVARLDSLLNKVGFSNDGKDRRWFEGQIKETLAFLVTGNSLS